MTERDELYDDMLDSAYPETPFDIPASRILFECDPIAYRVGLSEYRDSLCADGDHGDSMNGTFGECEWCGEKAEDEE